VEIYLHSLIRIHDEETLLKFYKMVTVARTGEIRNAYSILVGKPEGNGPLGRPRCRWEDNTRMDLREIGWEGVNWIHLAQNRDQWRVLANTAMNLRVP